MNISKFLRAPFFIEHLGGCFLIVAKFYLFWVSGITKDERDKVFQKFNERQALKDSIAFGSRILGKTLDPLRETDGEHNYTAEGK